MIRVWILLATVLLLSCGDKARMDEMAVQIGKLNSENASLKKENSALQQDLQKLQDDFARLNFLSAKMKGVKARIVTNYGNIELKFFPEKAPLHCFNFIARAEGGFYDNTQFHRVIPGFMIQGGDPNSRNADPTDDGMGGPLFNIPNEFNDIHHKPGILSMARTSDPAAGAGCQFFIMHGDAPRLDHQYTAFGEVTSGMDVVNQIANVRTYGNQNPQLSTHPVKPVVIRRIEVFR